MESQRVDWIKKCCECQKEFCAGWKEVYPNGYWTHGHIDKNVATERQDYKGQHHEWYYCDFCYHVEHIDDCEVDANNSCGCRHVFTCVWCKKIMSSKNEDTDHERACKNCINKIRALIV